MKKYYIVGTFFKKYKISVDGEEQPLILKWVDGMVGAAPVFENKDKADKYAKQTGANIITTNEESCQK